MKKSIKYTDSASKKLDSVLEKIKVQITDDIVSSKNYPGEELIEITASDIEETYQRLNLKTQKHSLEKRYKSIRMIFPIYLITGICLIIFGFFRSEIQNIIENDKVGLMYVLIGFVLTLVSSVMLFWTKQRDIERKRNLDKVHRKIKEEYSEIEKLLSEIEKNTEIDRISTDKDASA